MLVRFEEFDILLKIWLMVINGNTAQILFERACAVLRFIIILFQDELKIYCLTPLKV